MTFAPGMSEAVPFADAGVVVEASALPLAPTRIARLRLAADAPRG